MLSLSTSRPSCVQQPLSDLSPNRCLTRRPVSLKEVWCLPVSTTVAKAVLRQLEATFAVRIAGERYRDSKAGVDVWKLTAVAESGEMWTSRHEDFYGATCGLAALMGFELKDG